VHSRLAASRESTLSAGPQLASEIIKRWFNRRRPAPPRALRIVLEVNGKTFVDISSKLALAMIDCEYGKPVVMSCATVSQVLDGSESDRKPTVHFVKITFSEADA